MNKIVDLPTTIVYHINVINFNLIKKGGRKMSILLLVGVLVWAVIVVKHGHEVRKFGGRLRYKHVKQIKKMVAEGKSWEDIQLFVNTVLPTNIFASIAHDTILLKTKAYWLTHKPN